MNYLTDLTKEEIKYVCTVIPFKEASTYFRKYPKEFSKLKPGFRVKSLNEDIVIQTLYDFRNRDFIAFFLFKHIDRWIEEIDGELVKALESEIDQEAAYIDVLSRSFFSGNVALFFKIKGEEKSEDYLKVMRSSVLYQSDHQKTNGEELDFLKKKQRELMDIQEGLKNKISDEEKNVESMKEIVPVIKDLLTKAIVENAIRKLEKIPEPECSQFVAATKARFLAERDNSIRQRLAVAKIQEPIMQGHDLSGKERFRPETRHMIALEVQKDCFVGFKGERFRFYLSDEGYRNAKYSEQEGEIKIKSHAAVVAGKIYPHKKSKQQER